MNFPDQLHSLSYRELLEIEDEILLRNELRPSDRSEKFRWDRPSTFFSSGRIVVFALGALFFAVFLFVLRGVFEKLGRQNNPLSIPIYIGCLGGGVIVAHFLWSKIGILSRVIIRKTLHYWPVLLACLATGATLR